MEALAGGTFEGAQPLRHPARRRAAGVSPVSTSPRCSISFRTSPSLAETTSVADPATHAPTSPDLERVAKFTREPFLTEGEDRLAPGTPAAGSRSTRRSASSTPYCRRSTGGARSRCCSGSSGCSPKEEPKLVDGTVLSAHQVDALSGTLTALLAEAQRNGNGHGNGYGNGALADDVVALAPVGIPGEDDADDDDEPEEPLDWRPADAAGDTQLEEQPEDPNAAKRFWFEHATGAGKTVAALGFVEASRTGGVLILTHRRNLVDQFHGELRDRGYASGSRPPCSATRIRATVPSRSRPTSGSSATRARSPTPTRSSSATRRTRPWARRLRPRSATGAARSSSA